MAYQTIPPSGGGTSWYDLEAAAHASAVAELTESVPVTVGISSVSEALAASVVDAAVEGGALKGNSAWAYMSRATVYQAANTSKFAISFQCSLAALVVAKSSHVGIVNTAGTQFVSIATAFGQDAVNFIGQGNNGAATSLVTLGAADTSVWTFRVTSDGTTVTFSRHAAAGGGGALASGTVLTAAANYPSVAMAPGFFGTAPSASMAVYKCLFSYVGPG